MVKRPSNTKVEASITNKGPIIDFIFNNNIFSRQISMHAIDD
jgi:hypothetical protein